jgi:hypothetical protein
MSSRLSNRPSGRVGDKNTETRHSPRPDSD